MTTPRAPTVVLSTAANRAVERDLPEAVAAAVVEFLFGPLAADPHPVGTPLRFELGSKVDVDPDQHNGLDRPWSAQCQHMRAVAAARLGDPLGNVGTAALAQVREVLGLILDVPA